MKYHNLLIFTGILLLSGCLKRQTHPGLVEALNARAQDYPGRIRVDLPDQENNLLKASQPGIGCWFWLGREFEADGYKPFIDLYSSHTNIQLLTTSIRHNRWVGDPAVHDQVKAAAVYARAHGMGIVFDLDIRLSRESFRERFPDEQQEIVRMAEIGLKESGMVTVRIEGMKIGDHYTFGPAPDYDSYASRLLRVYSYTSPGTDVQDITGRCQVVKAGGDEIQVSIACNDKDKGRKACVMALFTLFTPDVFSPHLPGFEKDLLEQYADVPLAGACKDEWGFPGRFDPLTSDLWYSEAMANAYANRRPGHELARDMLLMHLGGHGNQPERVAAINHYMQMIWQQCAKVENLYYESIKEYFGDESMVMTHPTWVPFPDNREIFKNGLDWWAVKRDLAQTDESTPYCVRTALAKKWHSPLWYNMLYHESIEPYQTGLWQSLLGGGRLNYHPLFPYPDWLSDPEWNQALLKDSLMQAESRVQLLNYISAKPVDCPVAVIFGHAAALNWTESGFADVGLKVTDKLWEAGFYADLIPTSEIAGGALKIGADGSIRYGEQRYRAVILYHPEYEQKETAEFFIRASANGKTKMYWVGNWSRNFEGIPFDGAAALPAAMQHLHGDSAAEEVIGLLKSEDFMPYSTCTPNSAYYGSSMVPGTSGQLQLLDGTVILASGNNEVMGDPIRRTIKVNGQRVEFDAVGIAAVRLDKKGKVEALAGGGLKLFVTDDLRIELSGRTDLALWRDKKGEWHGVLHGFKGPVPDELTRITTDWIQMSVPAVLK
jgi:hypothetical protein